MATRTLVPPRRNTPKSKPPKPPKTNKPSKKQRRKHAGHWGSLWIRRLTGVTEPECKQRRRARAERLEQWAASDPDVLRCRLERSRRPTNSAAEVAAIIADVRA